MYAMGMINESIQQTIRRLIWFPVIMTLCWTPATIVDVYEIFYELPQNEWGFYINYISTILAILPGICIPLVFYIVNPFILKKWRNKYTVWLHNGCMSCNDTSSIISELDLSTVTIEKLVDYRQPLIFTTNNNSNNNDANGTAIRSSTITSNPINSSIYSNSGNTYTNNKARESTRGDSSFDFQFTAYDNTL